MPSGLTDLLEIIDGVGPSQADIVTSAEMKADEVLEDGGDTGTQLCGIDAVDARFISSPRISCRSRWAAVAKGLDSRNDSGRNNPGPNRGQ
jgi:hypothetical protein